MPPAIAPPRRLPPLRRAAKRSDPSGWAGLGYAYYYGLGVRQDYALAAKALSAAARLGHLDAIFNLGVLALRGEGMEPSLHKAERFWRVAADCVSSEGFFLLFRRSASGAWRPTFRTRWRSTTSAG